MSNNTTIDIIDTITVNGTRYDLCVCGYEGEGNIWSYYIEARLEDGSRYTESFGNVYPSQELAERDASTTFGFTDGMETLVGIVRDQNADEIFDYGTGESIGRATGAQIVSYIRAGGFAADNETGAVDGARLKLNGRTVYLA